MVKYALAGSLLILSIASAVVCPFWYFRLGFALLTVIFAAIIAAMLFGDAAAEALKALWR